MALDVLQSLVNLPDAPPNHAPVRLELRLAGASGPDPAPEALEVGPLPHQARQEVRELGQLDLELPLAGPRALGEDVEDQGRPVDDPKLQRSRQVSLLDGREGIVGDQKTGAQRPGERPDLFDLAFPEVKAGVRRAALLDDAGDHFRPGALGQAAQLLHRLLHLPPLLAGKPESHEDRPVDRGLYARHAQSAYSKKRVRSTIFLISDSAFPTSPGSLPIHERPGSRANQVHCRFA